MKNLFFYTSLVCFIGIGLYACDSTTSPKNPIGNSPAITDLSISPDNAQFREEEHGYRDTTLTIQIQGNTKNLSPNDQLRYSVSTKGGDTILEETITASQNGTITETILLETTTTTIQDYVVNVFVNAESGQGNYAQTFFEVKGFSNFPPEILRTDSPDQITRPSTGQILAIFTAKVVDLDGQYSIDKVYIRVIDQQSGEVEDSPFEMFDDGRTYNDEIASDSVYTWAQPVPPNETNPNRDYDIQFFSIDKGGLSSDTVRTTFSIRE